MAAACYTVNQGMPFLFTEANWSSTKWYLEGQLKRTVGTGIEAVWIRLWNETDSVEVLTSLISTASITYVRLRSATFTLTDGKEYYGQFGVDSGVTGAGFSLRLIND